MSRFFSFASSLIFLIWQQAYSRSHEETLRFEFNQCYQCSVFTIHHLVREPPARQQLQDHSYPQPQNWYYYHYDSKDRLCNHNLNIFLHFEARQRWHPRQDHPHRLLSKMHSLLAGGLQKMMRRTTFVRFCHFSR